MPRRRKDADQRRFLDEFEKVRISRFRAMGVVDPAKRQALIPFPNGKIKLLNVAHTKLKYGGGFSYFLCPHCQRLTVALYLIDDAPMCVECCARINILPRNRYGFGRAARRKEADRYLDELIAKVNTAQRLTFKARAFNRRMRDTQALEARMRRAMITNRLNQLASQQAGATGPKAYVPHAETRQLINFEPIKRARTLETLERALDKAQTTILRALQSNDPALQLSAARLMLRTKNARDRGLA